MNENINSAQECGKKKKSFTYIVKGILEEFADIVDSILSSVFVVLVFFTFIFSIARVEGRSMLETLKPDDRLIVSQLFYTPKDGDIVIINSEELEKKIVKRVIATEGQTLELNEGKVYVDGKELEEGYLSETNAGKTWTFTSRDDLISEGKKITIPEGKLFVMGDNRIESKDSRLIGFIDNDEVVGKVIFRLYPLESLGIV